MVYNILLGLAIAGIVVLGVIVALDITGKIASNQAAIHRLDRLTKRLDRLTNPTPAQFREQLREGLRRCLAEPECRRLFPGSRRAGKAALTPPTQGTPQSHVSGPDTATPRHPSAAKRSPAKRRPAPGGGGKSPAKPPSGGSGGGGAPIPGPSPATNLTAPLPVTICTSLVGVNCS